MMLWHLVCIIGKHIRFMVYSAEISIIRMFLIEFRLAISTGFWGLIFDGSNTINMIR